MKYWDKNRSAITSHLFKFEFLHSFLFISKSNFRNNTNGLFFRSSAFLYTSATLMKVKLHYKQLHIIRKYESDSKCHFILNKWNLQNLKTTYYIMYEPRVSLIGTKEYYQHFAIIFLGVLNKQKSLKIPDLQLFSFHSFHLC